MIHLVKIFIKIIATIIGFLIYILEIITALVMWDEKFIRNKEFLVKVWDEN
tara:strand:- start:681 stop:833 length:153 start_codon:yes stop_codon:yes gene_type:complete